MKLSKQEICQIFRCSIEQLNKQYAYNAKGLREMERKAVKTGKKYNGYAAKELEVAADRYEYLSKSSSPLV